MRILAIESSGQHGSAAILLEEAGQLQLVRQTVLQPDQRTAQALAPAIQALLSNAEWTAPSIELVAVTVGPGSFTGLRIGVTTAKTFAYAIGAEIIGVNTLEVLAAQTPQTAQPAALWTILDAQRQELFVARFPENDGALISSSPETSILPQDTWLAQLRPGDRVTGPALRRLASRIPDGIELVPETHWQPTAESVGQVAWQSYRRGHRDDLWTLLPLYYRPSAAEEKANSKKQ